MCLRVLCVSYCAMVYGVVLFVLFVSACVMCLHGSRCVSVCVRLLTRSCAVCLFSGVPLYGLFVFVMCCICGCDA